MNEIKLDQSIPGWNRPDIQMFLGEHVSKLPSDAQILEIGAFFGRTTYVLGHNKPKTATLTTIDPWMTYDLSHFVEQRLHDGECSAEYQKMIDEHTSDNPRRIEGDDFFEMWKICIGEIENLNTVRAFSPVKDREWPMFDFIYHDASHHKEDVYADLCYWFPKLKSGAVLIMDDYDKRQFAGLCEAVDTYVLENNLVTRMIGPRNIELRRKG